MAPQGQQSERRLATTSCDEYEAKWNGQADPQDYVLSQADALTKNRGGTPIIFCKVSFFNMRSFYEKRLGRRRKVFKRG